MPVQLSTGYDPPAEGAQRAGDSMQNLPGRAHGDHLPGCEGQLSGSAPARAIENWRQLTEADVRKAHRSPALVALVRQLAQAALDRDDSAVRKVGEIFRGAFYVNHYRVDRAIGAWWTRDDFATELLHYVVTGVPPSLRAKPPGRDAVGEELSSRPDAVPTRPPLQQWLMNSDAPLTAYIWVTLANISVDIIRRGKVQARLGSTGEHIMLDRRSDADAPELPNSGRWQGGHSYPQEAAIEETQREARLALVMQSLTPREQQVLQAIRNDEIQADIATRLGVSEGRISVIKSTAIAKLRTALRALEIYPEGIAK
jgi:RNA polymerase sigma factor (sigma-70 family)